MIQFADNLIQFEDNLKQFEDNLKQFDDNLSTTRYNKPQRPNVQEFDNGDDYNG